MRIAIWKTGHEIADTIAEAVYEGLGSERSELLVTRDLGTTNLSAYSLHLSYGILRGSGAVFRQCERDNVPWINCDKGYWHSGHYSGFYRFSLNGTQQTIGLDKITPDYERWDKLGIDIQDTLPLQEIGPDLVCSPTEYVSNFFGIKPLDWIPIDLDKQLWRAKGCDRSLKFDLELCSKVITFNSSVGWEALRQGIPVVSDPTHSILGAYQKLVDKDLSQSVEERRKLFAIMAGLQLSLTEIRSGAIWPLIQSLISISDLTPAKK